MNVLQHITDLTKSFRDLESLARTCAIPYGEGRLLIQTVHSLKYVVPTDDLVMVPQLAVYKQWEPDLSALLLDICKPGSTFVHVGANFGYFTCLVANRIAGHPQSKVIAIEPNPILLQLLHINSRINWSMAPVRVVPHAAGEKSEILALSIPHDSFANGTLAHVRSENDQDFRKFAVDVRPLDLILADESSIDVIKVDVEGFELAVFRGGRETLSRPGVILIFEWSMDQIREAGFDPDEMISYLHSLGFQLYGISPTGEVIRHSPLARDEVKQIPYANFICIK